MKRSRSNVFLDACRCDMGGAKEGDEVTIELDFPITTIEVGDVAEITDFGSAKFTMTVPSNDCDHISVIIVPTVPFYVRVHPFRLLALVRKPNCGKADLEAVVSDGGNLWEHAGVELHVVPNRLGRGPSITVHRCVYRVDRRRGIARVEIFYSARLPIRSILGMYAESQKEVDGLMHASFTTPIDTEGKDLSQIFGDSVERWFNVFTSPRLLSEIDALNARWRVGKEWIPFSFNDLSHFGARL